MIVTPCLDNFIGGSQSPSRGVGFTTSLKEDWVEQAKGIFPFKALSKAGN